MTSSSDLRNSWQQTKFRNESKASNKQSKHVAHYFSLKIANFINKSCHPSLCTSVLKPLVNQSSNMRMVSIKTNLSTHNQIDNHLLTQFNNLLRVIENNKHVLKLNNDLTTLSLLLSNPILLTWKLRNDLHVQICVASNVAKRATAQVKRLQSSPIMYPNHYLAIARMFYRCLVDTKKRQIWNDSKNSSHFRVYLKQCLTDGQNRVSVLVGTAAINARDEAQEPQTQPQSKMQKVKSNDSSCDAVEPGIYAAAVVIKAEDEDSKAETETETKTGIHTNTNTKTDTNSNKRYGYGSNPNNNSANVQLSSIPVDNKYHLLAANTKAKKKLSRTYFVGKRGGIFYLNSKQKKIYVKKKVDTHPKKQSNDTNALLLHSSQSMNSDAAKKPNGHSRSSKRPNTDIFIGYDAKHRLLYKGKRGGTYYLTKSRNKRYVKQASVLNDDNAAYSAIVHRVKK